MSSRDANAGSPGGAARRKPDLPPEISVLFRASGRTGRHAPDTRPIDARYTPDTHRTRANRPASTRIAFLRKKHAQTCCITLKPAPASPKLRGRRWFAAIIQGFGATRILVSGQSQRKGHRLAATVWRKLSSPAATY